MRYYCSYFDRNYLSRAIALADSLQHHEDQDFTLFAVCLDEISRVLLNKLNLPNVVAIPMHEIEQGDEALLATRKQRTLVEYYWTATPTIILRLLERNPQIDVLTYLDADLFFYSSPSPIFEELGSGSVLIHEHRYAPELAHLEPTSGRFNVGLLCFRNDSSGMEVLRWWRARCLEWCHGYYENGKYGDQLYLNDWPTRFSGVKILQHVGAGVAPWNHAQYRFEQDEAGHALVDGLPLVFYHFHSLAFVTPDIVIPIKHLSYSLSDPLLRLCFHPYVEALFRAGDQLSALLVDFSFGLVNSNLLSSHHTFLAKKSVASALSGSGLPNSSYALSDGLDCYTSSQQQEFRERIQEARQVAESAPLEDALRHLDAIEARFAGAAEFINLRAELLFAADEHEQAEALLSALAERCPTEINTLNNLAVIRWERGELSDAFDLAFRAWKLDPLNKASVITYGDMLTALAHVDEAANIFRAYLNHQPGDSEVRERLGQLGGESQPAASNDDDHYLVTAIVSAYNSERFMQACLEDLLAQTIADRLEIIVIDSASPQGERQIVADFQKRFANIRYVRTEEREGVYAAWNRGVQLARGKYLTNANTDDRHRPEAFERMVQILDAMPDIALVYADVLVTETENETFANCRPVGQYQWLEWDRQALLYQGCFMGPQPMWRRSIHQEYGFFDESFVTSGDYEFWLRISQTHDFFHLPEILGLYLKSPTSIEHSNRDRQAVENQRILRMYQAADAIGTLVRRQYSEEPSLLLEIHNHRGEELFERGEFRKARVIFEQILERDPTLEEPLNNLGVVLFQQGELERAIDCFRWLLQQCPQHLDALENLAQCHAALGNALEASRYLEQLLQLEPDHAGARQALDECHRMMAGIPGDA